ncbi:MAG TPA: MiaB/RimO family radical SAM methylthiotransferase, partial [Anaerolineales bacterium]|nr:MiaB/RimO family radical SAM methylthiotransferase [Anaerolineales bacterium]
REPIPGHRLRTRAFIKVQDGCDNFCTYCITRLARGHGVSRPVENVLMDVRSALEGGSQEIVLTGVHLGSWGYDFDPPDHLQHLIQEILDCTNVPRLHLSSIEPWDISPEFLALWKQGRLIRHIHLPLQSGCASTLQRMGRKITPGSYVDLVRIARQLIPDVSITTDIITGFPGESEDEFSESLAFVESMNFANGHVFTFSPRPGTAAMNLPDHIHPSIAKQRNSRIRRVLEQSASAYRSQYVGQDLSVLWENASLIDDQLWQLSGLSDNYLRVRATSSIPIRNQIMNIHLTGSTPDGLIGEILPK